MKPEGQKPPHWLEIEWARDEFYENRRERYNMQREMESERYRPEPIDPEDEWRKRDAAARTEAEADRERRFGDMVARGLNLTEAGLYSSSATVLMLPSQPEHTEAWRAEIRERALAEANNPRWGDAMQAEFRRIAETI